MDVVVAGVTAASALVFGLDLAILIGIAMSVVLFVPRAAKVRAGELILAPAMRQGVQAVWPAGET